MSIKLLKYVRQERVNNTSNIHTDILCTQFKHAELLLNKGFKLLELDTMRLNNLYGVIHGRIHVSKGGGMSPH